MAVGPSLLPDMVHLLAILELSGGPGPRKPTFIFFPINKYIAYIIMYDNFKKRMVKYKKKKEDHSCTSRSILWNLDYRGREIKNLKE